MDWTKRIFGYGHVIVASLVAVQFVASEIRTDDAVARDWEVLNLFMAVAAIAALVFSYLRARDAHRSDLQEWLASSAMLIASAVLFLMYFEQWFAWTVFKDADDELGEFRSLVWIAVDVMFPIVNMIVGIYLLRSVGFRPGDKGSITE